MARCARNIVTTGIEEQIQEVGLSQPEKYLAIPRHPVSVRCDGQLCTIIPGFEPPTGSLSTTAALALCVFVAVPSLASGSRGWVAISRPTPSPRSSCCHSISSVNFAHAGARGSPVRQHDERSDDHRHPAHNHAVYFPVVMTALGLLTGMVQAYIFSILAQFTSRRPPRAKTEVRCNAAGTSFAAAQRATEGNSHG